MRRWETTGVDPVVSSFRGLIRFETGRDVFHRVPVFRPFSVAQPRRISGLRVNRASRPVSLVGVTTEAAAEILGIPIPTASRYWACARSLLCREVRTHQAPPV